MKYNIGETVCTLDILGYVKRYTIIGKIHYKIFGFTYRTKYVCELLENKESIFKERDITLSGRKIHRIEAE